jgi:hypothetical protein
MSELILLTILSGLTFLLFLTLLILGLMKKNKKLKLAALSLFFVFIGLTGWTGFQLINKSYNKIKETFKPRTGDEIYDALFDKRQTNCIKILHHIDQVIPKIDYAIWLHLETCPKELKRILSRHTFMVEKLPTTNQSLKITYDKTMSWFNPKTLGDSLIIYEYATEDRRNIQTIWSNFDSTTIFVRDIFD